MKTVTRNTEKEQKNKALDTLQMHLKEAYYAAHKCDEQLARTLAELRMYVSSMIREQK